eukprot:500509-Hanusia_phi.AAC.6
MEVDRKAVKNMRRMVKSVKEELARRAGRTQGKGKGGGASRKEKKGEGGVVPTSSFKGVNGEAKNSARVHLLLRFSNSSLLLSNFFLPAGTVLALHELAIFKNIEDEGADGANSSSSPLRLHLGSAKPSTSSQLSAQEGRSRRQEQERILRGIEGLEAKLAMGALATVEAAAASHPEDFILSMARGQLRDICLEFDKLRAEIACDLEGNAPPWAGVEEGGREREGKEEGEGGRKGERDEGVTVKDLHISTKRTLDVLESLLSSMSGQEEGGGGRGGEWMCADELDLDSDEMIEMFDRFCKK